MVGTVACIVCSGVVATVFGATGFLARYVVQQLGTLRFLFSSSLIFNQATVELVTWLVIVTCVGKRKDLVVPLLLRTKKLGLVCSVADMDGNGSKNGVTGHCALQRCR